MSSCPHDIATLSLKSWTHTLSLLNIKSPTALPKKNSKTSICVTEASQIWTECKDTSKIHAAAYYQWSQLLVDTLSAAAAAWASLWLSLAVCMSETPTRSRRSWQACWITEDMVVVACSKEAPQLFSFWFFSIHLCKHSEMSVDVTDWLTDWRTDWLTIQIFGHCQQRCLQKLFPTWLTSWFRNLFLHIWLTRKLRIAGSFRMEQVHAQSHCSFSSSNHEGQSDTVAASWGGEESRISAHRGGGVGGGGRGRG